MNTYDTQAVIDTLAEEADSMQVGTAPVDAIIRRGRDRQRRHTATISTALVVGAVGLGYGVLQLRSSTSPNVSATVPPTSLESSSTSIGTATTVPVPSTSAVENTSPTISPTSAPVANPDPVRTGPFELPTAGRVEKSFPHPWKDGFLVTTTYSNDPGGLYLASFGESVAFSFSPDGRELSPVASPLAVAGKYSSVSVIGDTVMIVAVANDAPSSLRIYWSTDLNSWTDEVVSVASTIDTSGLTPAMRELVEVRPLFTSTPTVVGDRWMTTVETVLAPSTELVQKYDDTPDVYSYFETDGLHVGDKTYSPSELGLTDADIASFMDNNISEVFSLVAGQRGSATTTVIDKTEIEQVIGGFGDQFVRLSTSGEVSRSQDGAEWVAIQPAVGAGETVTAIGPFGGDVLVLTAGDGAPRSYRLSGDGTTIPLGELPLDAGMKLRYNVLDIPTGPAGTDRAFFVASKSGAASIDPGLLTEEDRDADGKPQVFLTASADGVNWYIHPELGVNGSALNGNRLLIIDLDYELGSYFTVLDLPK